MKKDQKFLLEWLQSLSTHDNFGYSRDEDISISIWFETVIRLRQIRRSEYATSN